MAAFLFVWNPKRYPLLDFMEEIRTATVENGVLRWSCGSRQDISAGDRAFLIRLGLAPKGIVAGGIVQCSPFKAPHWDPERAAGGGLASYVDVGIEDIQAEPFILREELQDIAPGFHWDSQMSGILIQPDYVVDRLEALWIERTQMDFRIPDEAWGSVSFREGALKQVQVNAYERNGKARRACLLHHGWACSICGLDFGETYGAQADGLIHVHHLKPLNEIGRSYQVDPINDLLPVCPNCHAVIHSGGGLRTPEEVRTMLQEGQA
jgi:5-methylcytosine-specific restriction protein A